MPKTPRPEVAAKAAARNTDSGPAGAAPGSPDDLPSRKMAEVQALVQAMPHNVNKPLEHGFDNAIQPQAGAMVTSPSRLATGSTLSEENGTEKTGSTALEGLNATIECVWIRGARCSRPTRACPSPTTRIR
jgi:catalase